MEARLFRELLLADLALERGRPAPEIAAALAHVLVAKEGSVLDRLGIGGEERRGIEADLDRLVAEAGGDAGAAAARRGLDRSIHGALDPAASRALGEADLRYRAPLRTVDPERYVGFTPLARGGMGVVYLAVDTELNRRVAFKIIRAGEGDSASPLDQTAEETPDDLHARFLQEAWVTGGLEHPGIVPVYELGQNAAGVPYYTMRLVRGESTLLDAIEAAGTLEQRLGLLEPFLKVCDAIRYAHNRGVVHRDLKPANVALGQFGEAVVLDWGLAKLSGRPDLAQSRWRARVEEFRAETSFETLGQALGTPGFMAPEAALGDVESVDERSDVYSLGAILYMILTGRPPVAAESFGELVEKLSRPPTPPAELDPAVPAELSRVCLRALAPAKEERYAGAGELAAAVRAWQTESAVEREIRALLAEAESALASAEGLGGEALLRRTDRAVAVVTRVLDLRPGEADAERLLAQARAARQGAIAASERAARRRLLKRVAVGGLAVATAATVVVAVLLNARRREAEEARRAEAVERARAEQLAGFMLEDLHTGLQEIGRLDLLNAVARRTLAHYEGAAEEGFDPHVWHLRMVAHKNLGETYEQQGDNAAALEHFRAGLELSRRLVAQEPDVPQWRLGLAVALDAVAKQLLAAGDLEGARRSAEESVGVAEQVVAEGGEAYVLGISLNRLGDVALATGDASAAAASYRRAAELLRGLRDRRDALARLGASLSRLGRARARAGDRTEALANYRESRAIYEQLLELDPSNVKSLRDLGRVHGLVGDELLRAGRLEGALESFRAGLAISERLVEREPANADWRFDLSVSHDRLGNVLLDSGDAAGALASYERSLAIRKELFAARPDGAEWRNGLSASYERVGDARSELDDLAGALAAYRESEDLVRPLVEDAPGNADWRRGLAIARMRVGEMLFRLGRHAEAFEALREAEAEHARLVEAAPHYAREHGVWEQKLRAAALFAGEAEPATTAERLDVAEKLLQRGSGAAAAPHYVAVLADAAVRADLARGNLYNGACAAAQASAAAEGAERERWRARALEWLAEDLRLRRALLDDPEQPERLRQAIRDHLQHAETGDPDLAPLRGLPAFRALFD